MTNFIARKEEIEFYTTDKETKHYTHFRAASAKAVKGFSHVYILMTLMALMISCMILTRSSVR